MSEFREDGRSYELKDSGDRTVFKSGAVRDCSKGKGRCDLLPFDVLSNVAKVDNSAIMSKFLGEMYQFSRDNSNIDPLTKATILIIDYWYDNDFASSFLELAVHFEKGAEKYSENNWKAGIPIEHYIDSATRHFLKAVRGDTDENHKVACLWNLVCCAWTVKNEVK